ncbi:MAG: histidine kinase [Gallionellales bacterium RIFOXYB12_FULL_54_9]|nr:MAG: histidine kinase [Gallionellales bacterium RIFOXYB12_FULL_54_9]
MPTERTRSGLTHALSRLDALPAMPIIAQKLLALQLDTAKGEAQLLTLIEQDPQISAKLISLANSPVMGVKRKICTVPDAAMLLGLNQVKSVSIGIATMSTFSRLPVSSYFSPQDLWLHSLTIAITMHTLSAYMPGDIRPRPEQIYLAGLLHDIGFMAIHHMDNKASDLLHHQLRLQPKRPIVEIELQILGLSHCHIGAQLARQWHLPEEIVNVLDYHHAPYVDKISDRNPMARMVNVAEKLLPNFGITEFCGTDITEREWQELGINPAHTDELINTTNELALQLAQIADVF